MNEVRAPCCIESVPLLFEGANVWAEILTNTYFHQNRTLVVMLVLCGTLECKAIKFAKARQCMSSYSLAEWPHKSAEKASHNIHRWIIPLLALCGGNNATVYVYYSYKYYVMFQPRMSECEQIKNSSYKRLIWLTSRILAGRCCTRRTYTYTHRKYLMPIFRHQWCPKYIVWCVHKQSRSPFFANIAERFIRTQTRRQ